MSDRFTDQVREALHDTAAAVQPGSADLDRVRTDADRRRPRDGRVVPLALAAVVLVVLGVVTVQVLERPSAVVLEDGTSGAAASAEALIGRTFTSTSVLPGAPAPEGVLTVAFTAPDHAEGPGRVLMAVRTEPGCNGGSVVAEVDAGGQTHLVTDILRTTAGCLALPMDMDDWWHDLLEAQPQLLLDGDRLVVRTDAGQIDLVDDSAEAGVLPEPPPGSFSSMASLSPSMVEPGDSEVTLTITADDEQLSSGTRFRVERWAGERWELHHYVEGGDVYFAEVEGERWEPQDLSTDAGMPEEVWPADRLTVEPGMTETYTLPLKYMQAGVHRIGLAMRAGGAPAVQNTVEVYARLDVQQRLTSEAPAPAPGPGPSAPPVVAIPTCEDFCGEDALGYGVLASDGESCVWIEGGHPTIAQNVVWPRGFAARFTEAGVELLGPDGEVVAREGDTLEMGGGSYDEEEPSCAPGEDDRIWRARTVTVIDQLPE